MLKLPCSAVRSFRSTLRALPTMSFHWLRFLCRLPFIDWLATVVAVMNDKLFICRLTAKGINRLTAQRIYRIDARSLHYLAPLVGGIMLLSV